MTQDLSTINGIIRYLKLWLESDPSTSTDSLKQGCMKMADILNAAISETDLELSQTGDTDESLAEPVESCILAYERLRDIVLDIAESASQGTGEAIRDFLNELEEAAEFLRRAQEELHTWLQAPITRCPRCGGQEGDPCPICHLELLFPDPQGGTESKFRSALLPQAYGPIFDAYTAVRNGEKTLSELIRLLPPVERDIREFIASVTASLSQQPDSASLIQARDTLVELNDGLRQIRKTWESRKMTDLQDGWAKVFRSAVRFERLRLELLEEFGGEQGLAKVSQERSQLSQQDSVSISFDD
ncbi:MAG: hypothetical protein JKY71_10960 [Alphaproteobacteria bacterium]|nr:hypothetical protein [Alphaproteobacteria bacterium]